MGVKRMLSLMLALALLGLAACGQAPAPELATAPTEATTLPRLAATEATTEPPAPGNIYLYGERHGEEVILEKELELWIDYYHNQGLRHLFMEEPYCTAQYLNQWMQVDSDDILDALFRDWQGTAGGVPQVKALFQQIKAQCPETVFHGTDVGHQYYTTGARYLYDLRQNGQQGTEDYALALVCVEQGELFYAERDDAYRENMMAENFIRAFDSLMGESVMGIYGAAHTGLEAMAFNGEVPCMGSQLYQHYGDIVQSWDLTYLALLQEPLRVDTLTVGGKDYQAAYYGEAYIGSWSEVYASREVWRLEDAYDDFKDIAIGAEGLPQSNSPCP